MAHGGRPQRQRGPVVAVPRPGASAADIRAVAQANEIRAQAYAAQRSPFQQFNHWLFGGLGSAARDAVAPTKAFIQRPGISTGIQALASLPLGRPRSPEEAQSPFL